MLINDLIQSQAVLQNLMRQKMPGKLAYAILKNARMVDAELETFEEARIKILEDNWKFNEETSKYDIPDEDQDRWHEMYDELVNQESDIKPYKISPSLLDGVTLSPLELVRIDWMIEE